MSSDPWEWQGFGASRAMSNGQSRTSGGQSREKPLEFNILAHTLDRLIDRLAPCPWTATAGSNASFHVQTERPALYTPDERRRRDSTRWTMVQGVLAPIQFAVFLVSLGLVVNYLWSGNGYAVAAASVIVKTLVLYTIMVTGAIWEKKVFGKYLFAPAFFWEDTVSMLVIALHTAYLLAMWSDWGSPSHRMVIALAAYTTYAINAAQFILKLRTARLEAPAPRGMAG
jgi:3-vinyl bacteriochlorophyllide hydratase